MIQHFGSTVGGFGSIVRHYARENITVAVIGNLEDGGFGAEYIAKRVADRYIPGAFAAGMEVSPDAVPNQTREHLQILKDISAGKTPAILSDKYASKISETFRTQVRENLKLSSSFVYLGGEKITANHFMLDPTADEILHYKMALPKKTVYYHFRFDKEHRLAWVSFEE